MSKLPIDRIVMMFIFTGFDIQSIRKIRNQYWPPAYTDLIEENPWWEVETQFGTVTLGWRKRVISIEWMLGFGVDGRTLTEDDTTKEALFIHAWSEGDALKYLLALRVAAEAAEGKAR